MPVMIPYNASKIVDITPESFVAGKEQNPTIFGFDLKWCCNRAGFIGWVCLLVFSFINLILLHSHVFVFIIIIYNNNFLRLLIAGFDKLAIPS